MIQLPSKIRTTLFNASVEAEPYQLFSHENDRLLIVIYNTYTKFGYAAFGRSKQDVLNSDALAPMFSSPILFYGPEPLWVGASTHTTPNIVGLMLVHGIYYAQ